MRFDFLVEHTGDLWVYGALYPRQQPGEKEEKWYHAKGTDTDKTTGQGCRYLGIILWGRSPEWPKATSFLGGSGGITGKFFERNMSGRRKVGTNTTKVHRITYKHRTE